MSVFLSLDLAYHIVTYHIITYHIVHIEHIVAKKNPLICIRQDASVVFALSAASAE